MSADAVALLAKACDTYSPPIGDAVRRLGAQAAALERIVAQWEEKARNWMASPAAVERLAGYRELADKLAAAEARVQELEAKVAAAERYERAVNEALNTGDGSYRP